MDNRKEINDLLDICKSEIGAKSDYQMAQMLEINKARITNYRSGERVPDTYACTRIAQALKRDPLEIIAMVEANSAKSEEQRAFWRSFKFSGMRNSLGLLLCGTLAFSGVVWQSGNAEAGAMEVRIMGDSVIRNMINRIRRRYLRRSVDRGEDRRCLSLN